MSSLPPFDKLWQNYPRGSADDVKRMIGGRVDADWIENTCAIRMSYAFNFAGHRIPRGCRRNWAVSDDRNPKLWYAYRVRALREYIFQVFGEPDIVETSVDGDDSIQQRYLGEHGVIAFDVEKWMDATGHFDIWNGQECAGHAYFKEAVRVELWRCSD